VHIGNDHVDLVNKANKTSESELLQLSNCDADRGDVTRKYVAAHSESIGHWYILFLMLVNLSDCYRVSRFCVAAFLCAARV
jgi:hypothetical protein